MRIKMEIENEFGSIYKLENSVEPYDDVGELDLVFDALKCLLWQAGYGAYNKDCLLKSCVTEHEADLLYEYLHELRHGSNLDHANHNI